MKTILIAHNYSTASIAAMSYHLAHYLVKKGMRVVFVSHRPYFEEPLRPEVEGTGQLVVYSWPTNGRPTSVTDAKWYYRLHRRYKPTVVIGHFVGANISAVVSKVASFGKVKTLVYYHTVSGAISLDKYGLQDKKIAKQRLRKRRFYKLFVDRLIAPSPLAKEDLEKTFGVSNCTLVPNAIPDRYETTTLDQDGITLSYLGRLVPTKGVLDMVAAFKEYLIIVPHSVLRLRLAGSGKQESDLLAMIDGVPQITFVSQLPYKEIDEFLRTSSFSIIPSKFDNLPTAGIESLMNKVPLLISEHTGLTKYIEHGKSGFVFSPEKEAMKVLFSEIEQINNTMAMRVAARKVYDDHFSMPNYCESILNLIE